MLKLWTWFWSKYEPPKKGDLTLGHIIAIAIMMTGIYLANHGWPD